MYRAILINQCPLQPSDTRCIQDGSLECKQVVSLSCPHPFPGGKHLVCLHAPCNPGPVPLLEEVEGGHFDLPRETITFTCSVWSLRVHCIFGREPVLHSPGGRLSA